MLRIIGLCAVLLLAGCSMFTTKDDDETSTMSEERLFNEARSRLNSGYWDGARNYYEKLQSRFPFGPYSQQGMLDLAYAYYKLDEAASTIATCDRFLKLHPTSPAADYAYYLKGLANFNAGKGLVERFTPNDPSQRDQGTALRSFQDFAELVRRFPDSKYAPDAQKRMTFLRNLLAQHELHVANYYMRRGAMVAAANRAKYVVENYQRTPAVPDALAVMAKAYKVLEMPELSDDALRVLELNHPDHPGLVEVREVVLKP
ncbi:MAG TPA: outer membrane protein assembly factor BamD [Gammaproteobacteria bacterium]|nr:outer membrane protein assembly factor BamD [Gammaproteobacteria bacterium]